MMDEKEITISFKDIFFRVLLKWRWIIISAILFAVLANCYGIYKDYRSNSKIVASDKKSDQLLAQVESAKKPLSEKEIVDAINAVQTYKKYDTIYKRLEEHVDNSILSHIDYTHTPTGELQFFVDEHYEVEYPVIEKQKYGEDIAIAYAEILNNENTYEELEELLGVDSIYIRELITVTTLGNYIDIIITGENKEQCGIIQDYYLNKVSEVKKQLNGLFPAFDLNVVADDFYYAFNEDVYTKQWKKNSDLNSYRTSCLNIQSGMSSEQKTLFDAELNYRNAIESENSVSDAEVEHTESNISFIHKKLILAGFIGGAFLVCLIVVVNYLLTPVIRVKENVSLDLNQNVLGTLWMELNKKKFLKFVDEWIIRAFNNKERLFSYANRIEMICASIRIGMEKEELKKVYITGASEKNKSVVADIEASLKEFCSVESGTSVLYDPESLKKMSASDSVIFVENIGDSKTEEVIKELELAEQSKVSVLGFVLLQ